MFRIYIGLTAAATESWPNIGLARNRLLARCEPLKIARAPEIAGVGKFQDSFVAVLARLNRRPGDPRAGREFQRRIKQRFEERGIAIPFPHQTLYFGASKDGSAPPVHVDETRSPQGDWPGCPSPPTHRPVA